MNLTSKLIKTEKQLNKWHQDANLLIEEKQRNQEELTQKINELETKAQLVTQSLESKELELTNNLLILEKDKHNLTTKLTEIEKQLNKWHQDANLLIEEKQRHQEELTQKISELREQAQLVTQNLELKELELTNNLSVLERKRHEQVILNRKKDKHNRKYFLLLSILVSVTGFIFFDNTFSVKKISKQDEVKQVIPVEVVKAEYSLGINNKLTTSGKTIAYETHVIKSNINGRVKELNCSVGQYVKKGDILAILDTEQIDYQIELITQEYELKKKKLDSIKKLLDKNLVSYVEYANYEIEYLNTKQRYYKLLDDKTNHYIVAPSSGIVEEKLVVNGEFVTQKDKIVVIHDIQIVKVGFNIDELDYQKFKSAKQSYVNIYLPALDLSLKLSNFKTSEIAQEKNHSVYIEAFIPNDDNLITPGLFVNVDVIFSDDQQVIKLPNSTIFFEDHYFCYVIENDIAKKVEVEISDSDNTNISVISPIIKSGDQVVVSGKKGLYDGAKVLIDNTSVVSP